jgi:hypothetical protein
LQGPLAKPWRSVHFELPNTIPTMISAEERSYLYWLGRDFWTGRGEVIEMGPWLGGSTYSLAAGMAAKHPEAQRRLHVFDSFIWRPFMAQRARLPLEAGQSFRSYFERNLEPFRELLVVESKSLPDDKITGESLTALEQRVDIAESDVLRWTGAPIEILFVDGAKSWDGFLYLLKETAASLIPGVSLLVCQDYKHWGSYWVPAILELLGGHVRLVHVLEQNTVTFQWIKPIETAELLRLADYASLLPSRGAAALESAARRLEGLGDAEGASLLRLAEARYLGQRGARDDAIAQFRAVERVWSARFHQRGIDDTRRWLETLFSTSLPTSALLRARRESYRVLRYGRRLFAGVTRLIRSA